MTMVGGHDGEGNRDGDRVGVVVGGTGGWLPPRVLAPWLGDPRTVEQVRGMARVSGLDLIRLGTVAGQQELADPALSLPLATALAILAGQRLLAAADPDRVIIAGHGAGEIAAAVVAGVLEPDAGVDLAVRVGQAQATSATRKPGGQVALLGGYPADVEQRAAALRLSIAAYNGAGDIVVAGPRPALDELLGNPPRHTRAELLPAIGAFYGESMAPAAVDLRSALPELTILDPRFALLSGRDGRPATSGHAFMDSVASLLTGPLRWDLIMAAMTDAGVRTIMELPPAGVLTSLVTRGAPGVTALPLRTPDALDEAGRILAKR